MYLAKIWPHDFKITAFTHLNLENCNTTAPNFLRLIHVFNEDLVDAIFQWTDQKWFFMSGLFIVTSASATTFGAFMDYVPQLVYKNATYDPMIALWYSKENVEFYVQPLVNVTWMTYTIFAVVMTTLFHQKILTHLNEKFVNLAGITKHIRERRKKQNASNFKGSVLFQIWRLFAVVPVCILSLFPSSFVQSEQGQMVYLIFHFSTSIYQSCGVASFFLATYTIFNRKNHMGKLSISHEILARRLLRRISKRLQKVRQNITDNIFQMTDRLVTHESFMRTSHKIELTEVPLGGM